jgi:hypothetical protein
VTSLERVREQSLSRHLLPAERFTERSVDTAKTVERLIIAEEVHDTRMLVQRRRNHDEQLPTCSRFREST